MDEITNEDIYALIQEIRADLAQALDTLGGGHGEDD
jgi:hypothetical protein